MDIIAITVSTNYEDIIPHTIKHNKDFFKKWIFITDPSDKETIDILEQHDNIIVLFFNFEEDAGEFNKGGAFKVGQEYAYNNFPDNWYLIIDSDICLENNFKEYMDSKYSLLKENYIYSTRDRRDYLNITDYKNRENYWEYAKNDPNGEKSTVVAGYFQLYREKLYYKDSYDCSWCDIEFSNNFLIERDFLDVTCNHLGTSYHNWKGRKNKTDFIQ